MTVEVGLHAFLNSIIYRYELLANLGGKKFAIPNVFGSEKFDRTSLQAVKAKGKPAVSRN
jgi:hypothetical protein